MTVSISSFKNAFNGGTRANRFVVEGNIPFSSGGFTKFHIKATTIPAVSSERIEYPYFGRKAYYPGEKKYGLWSVTVIDDTGTDGDLWKKFHNWQNRINNHETNISIIPGINVDYKAYNWNIKHLNLNGEENPHKTYTMHGCWPKTIGEIRLSMTNINTLVEFEVTFSMDWIEIAGVTDVVPSTQ